MGDPRAAMTEVLHSHGARMLAALRRLLGNEEEARDAFQDGMLAAWQSLPSFEARSQLSTWVHRIVVNHAVDSLRRKRRLEERSLDALLPSYTEYGHRLVPQREWRDGPAALVARAELREIVGESIRRLPAALRVPLVLYEIENVQISEIAALLETTENAVRIRVHRARQALKADLDPHLTETTT